MENLFETLVAKLHKGIVSFVFRKKDGTKRHACGTLYGNNHRKVQKVEYRLDDERYKQKILRQKSME